MSKKLHISCFLVFIAFICFASCKEEDGKSYLTDIEGNDYEIVKIGDQLWMAENLRATKYNDGTEILLIEQDTDWNWRNNGNVVRPAYSWYENDEAANKEIYGALYSWEAVNTHKLCPKDWHVPAREEWDIMENYLGENAAGKLRERGTEHWPEPNENATNESGFTARASGRRCAVGCFITINNSGFWWTATEDTSDQAVIKSIYINDFVDTYSSHRNTGASVRCVMD